MRGARLLAGVAALTVVCGLLVAAAVVARGGLASDGWSIQWIEVSGPFERISAEQIRAAAAPLAGGGFVAVDLDKIRQVVEALPWVRAAGVRKQWPDKLRIRVLEHEPLAQWRDGALVSAYGEVFSVDGVHRIEGLPSLGGPAEEAPRIVRFYQDLSNRLEGTGLDVASVDLTRRGAWSVELTGGVRLLVGRQQVESRLNRLMRVIGELTAEPGRQLDRIDLRYTNGLAVRWHNEPAALAEVRVEDFN